MNKKNFISILNKPSYPLVIIVILFILKLIFSPIDERSLFYNIIENKISLIILGIWLINAILHTGSEKVAKVLFNPCSPIITLIVGWLLTLLVTSVEEGSDISLFIQILIKNKSLLLIILACWLVTAIMYTNNEQVIEERDKKIIELEQTIKEKENQLNQSSGIILNKYGEFAKFNRKNRFYEVLESFTNNNDIVDSSQIYKYSSRFDNSNFNIRLTYEEGYAYEGVEINNILQSYYSINRKDYKDFKEILYLWKKYIIDIDKYTEKEKECLEKNLLDDIENLLTRVMKKLSKIKRIKNIKNSDFDMYTFATLLIRMLRNNEMITEIECILDKKHIESFLKSGKRTGLLGSILLEDTYIFKHVGNSSKHGRVYFTFHLEISGENYIVLFAIVPSKLDESEEWYVIFEELKKDFIERLKRTGCNI